MAKSKIPAPKKATPKKTAPKKSVSSKKAASSKNEIGIKYADKSAGQPELVPIFETIKNMLLPYEKGSIKLRGGTGGQIAMVSEKPIEIDGRKRDELWFAAALVQKGYVGFYFMPVYDKKQMEEMFKPELLKCLKGKGCFHIKKADPLIYAQIKESLKKGYDSYKAKGWV
jgi:hypothetical protein